MIKNCSYCLSEFKTSHSYKTHCSSPICKSKYHIEKSYIKSKCPICESEFKHRKCKPKTYCSKKCSMKSESVISKMVDSQKNTFNKKYGCHPMSTDETKKNLKESMIKNHGVEYALQNADLLEKMKKTLIEKYGVDSIFKVKEIQQAIKQTNIERFGAVNPMNNDSILQKRKETIKNKYGVDHFSKTSDFKNKIFKNTYDKLSSSDKFKNIITSFSLEDFKGVNEMQYKFICIVCNNEFMSSIDNGVVPKCQKCFSTTISSGHKEIWDFIKFICPDEYIEINNRTVLDGKELDIYMPNRDLAIEYNGMYWHSEISGNKDKNYHLNKTNMCESKNIKLLHIFENEWIHKRNIVTSIICNIFGISNKIYARNCTIELISPAEKNLFLAENHLQGSDIATISIGLRYKTKLVSVMTFVKSRFDKNYEWELSRFCNIVNTNIIGGANKLFQYFIKNYNPNTIITYSNRRYFDGKMYLQLGFSQVGYTMPNYWYRTNNINIHNRINYQKHKLKSKLNIFDNNISEWENMKNNGYDRIWDCGNIKFIWTN